MSDLTRRVVLVAKVRTQMKTITHIFRPMLLVVPLLALATPGALAQGSQRVGVVQPAYSSTPACAPAATIYSDPMLMNPVTQPLVSDGLGNYSYFGVAGTYTEEITGPMITGYTSTMV